MCLFLSEWMITDNIYNYFISTTITVYLLLALAPVLPGRISPRKLALLKPKIIRKNYETYSSHHLSSFVVSFYRCSGLQPSH